MSRADATSSMNRHFGISADVSRKEKRDDVMNPTRHVDDYTIVYVSDEEGPPEHEPRGYLRPPAEIPVAEDKKQDTEDDSSCCHLL